jgi:hypothetical protein
MFIAQLLQVPKRVSKILFVDTMNIKNKTYITLNYILSKSMENKATVR